MPPFTLGIMAKFWRAGNVKTRLGATIGMQAAADLHELFCRHLVESLAKTADRRTLVIWPPESMADFRAWLGDIDPGGNWCLQLQCEGDLGLRMRQWFAAQSSPTQSSPTQPSTTAIQSPPAEAGRLREDRILIGADCPLISSQTIHRARQLLRDHDLVLGPARDGGYYLIGLRGPWNFMYEVLFENMKWSDHSVFEVTKTRAAQASLTMATLETMEDIDTHSELQRLQSRLIHTASTPERRLRDSIQRVLSAGSDR